MIHQSGQAVSLNRAPWDLFEPSTTPSLWQRILNGFEYFSYFKEIDSSLVSPTEIIVRQVYNLLRALTNISYMQNVHFPNRRHLNTEHASLRYLYGQISLFLFNTHSLTHGSIPMLSNVIQVGSFQDERFSKPYLVCTISH